MFYLLAFYSYFMNCSVAFLATWWLSFPTLHNHGLWLSLILYLATRGLVQTLLFPRYRLAE